MDIGFKAIIKKQAMTAGVLVGCQRSCSRGGFGASYLVGFLDSQICGIEE